MFIITVMRDIYSYIPETSYVSRVHNVAAVLYLQFVLHVILFRMLNITSINYKNSHIAHCAHTSGTSTKHICFALVH